MNVRLASALAVVLLSVGACSSGGGSRPPATHSPSGSRAATASAGRTFAALRWWSNTAVRAGSAVDAAGADSVVGSLHPSRSDYCGMLRQTTKAGKSLFSGVSPADKGMQSTVRAFVAEVSAVAPAALASAWHTVGVAIVAVATSGGHLSRVKGVEPAQVQRAAGVIAADAEAHCHLVLSA